MVVEVKRLLLQILNDRHIPVTETVSIIDDDSVWTTDAFFATAYCCDCFYGRDELLSA